MTNWTFENGILKNSLGGSNDTAGQSQDSLNRALQNYVAAGMMSSDNATSILGSYAPPVAPTPQVGGGLTTTADMQASADANKAANLAAQNTALASGAGYRDPTTGAMVYPTNNTSVSGQNGYNNNTLNPAGANPLPPNTEMSNGVSTNAQGQINPPQNYGTPTSTNPASTPALSNTNSQLGALNTGTNVGVQPTTNNGIGNNTTGSQGSTVMPPGQVGASFGNISQQMTPQDQQRQAIKTDPNNITGYQNLSTNF